MDQPDITDAGTSPPVAQRKVSELPLRRVCLVTAALALLLGLTAFIEGDPQSSLGLKALWQDESAQSADVRALDQQIRSVEIMNVDDREQIIAQGDSAQQRNLQIPFSLSPLEKAGTFILEGLDETSSAAALKCMTQAIYYEAGFEPLKGRRAVAQIVLNRVRHPAYPNSICGVVYQGSERYTGCQFSFTCDGSLLRRPAPAAWREAEKVARAALSGYVETSVGTATHYHADYVLPKWAFRLGKVRQLGMHIFYRFSGPWGSSKAFSSRYSGVERIPQLNFAALRERLLASGGEVTEQVVPGLSVPPHITDRHAENDVGGRLDVTKEWRLSIPDPVEASSRYRAAIDAKAGKNEPNPSPNLAVIENSSAIAPQ